jgi:hypothetical protein
MKTNRRLNQITRMSLLAALLCATPLVRAGDRREGQWASPQEQTTQLEARSQVAPARGTMTKDYIRQRLDWLKIKDPRHYRVFAYFDTLLLAGYDPFLLDEWLDGIYDGVVIVGMPDELVLDYWGQPVFTNAIVHEGLPAQVWGVRLLPGRVEKVTVAGGKVVSVRG